MRRHKLKLDKKYFIKQKCFSINLKKVRGIHLVTYKNSNIYKRGALTPLRLKHIKLKNIFMRYASDRFKFNVKFKKLLELTEFVGKSKPKKMLRALKKSN